MRAIILIVLMLTSTCANAYVGPGLGLGVIGVILGALVAVLLAIFGVVWYPIKRILKKKKKNVATEPNGEEKAQDAEERQRNDEVD